MNAIASVGLGTPTISPVQPGPAAPAAPAAPATAAGPCSRDAQMAELGSTQAGVNALQSLAMQAPATAPITIPPTQHTSPQQANTSNELVDAMSGGGNDDG